MLDEIRNKINFIDEKIMELLKERLQLVEKVGHIKQQTTDNSKSFMRPDREATVIEKQLDANDSSYPKKTIINLWRNIISASVNMEQPLSICAFEENSNKNNYWLAREYFGNICEIETTTEPADIIRLVNEDKFRIGILPVHGNWWHKLPQDIRIFAKLGDEKNGYAYCIAKIDLDYKDYEGCTFLALNEDCTMVETNEFSPDMNLIGCYFEI